MSLQRGRDSIFYEGLRPIGEIMSLVVTTDLPLEVVPLPMVGCFSGSWLIGLAFFRMGLVGRNLNIGTQISMKAPKYGRKFLKNSEVNSCENLSTLKL